jgi:thioredoxin-related protein
MNTGRSIVMILLLVCAGWIGCSPSPDEMGSKATPTSSFLETHGLLGHVTLLEFGAVGCEVSEKGLERMNAWQRGGDIKGLRYIRIEGSRNEAAADAYYSSRKDVVPVVRDADSAIARTFNAMAIPTFVLADKFGRIRYRGSLPADNIEEWSRALVAEKTDNGTDALMFGVADLDINKLLLDTSLPSADGSPAEPLHEKMGGNGLMIVFVDTECPFAGQVMKEMPDIAKVLAKQKIPTVLVNIDDDKAAVTKFYKEQKVGVPVVYDEGTSTHLKWGVSSVPTVFLINSKGELLYNGVSVWANVVSAVEKDLGASADSLAIPHRGTEYG